MLGMLIVQTQYKTNAISQCTVKIKNYNLLHHSIVLSLVAFADADNKRFCTEATAQTIFKLF